LTRLCLDLNVWCAAYLADRDGRRGSAAQTLVEATTQGGTERQLLQLVVSWGMIERLHRVLIEQLEFHPEETDAMMAALTSVAHQGPSLTLGGVGVIPIYDAEDRHVLETAWAGRADILVTANLVDFVQPADEVVLTNRLYYAKRGGRSLILAHPFAAAAWLREGQWPAAET
jgi:predicted nucleic acid-binding protein